MPQWLRRVVKWFLGTLLTIVVWTALQPFVTWGIANTISLIYSLPAIPLVFKPPSLDPSGAISFGLAGLTTYLILRRIQATTSGALNSSLEALPEVVLDSKVMFRDHPEAKEFASLFSLQGGSLVAVRLDERYGRGFIQDDLEIIRTVLLNGKNTPRDLAVFLNRRPEEVLTRLKFMEQKGVLDLRPDTRNRGRD